MASELEPQSTPTVPLLIEGQVVGIPVQRPQLKGEFGKKYVCGQSVDIKVPVTRKDPKTGENLTIISTKTIILTGEQTTVDRMTIDLGCGTEMLCMNKNNPGFPECCGSPMSLMKPAIVPSAD